MERDLTVTYQDTIDNLIALYSNAMLIATTAKDIKQRKHALKEAKKYHKILKTIAVV